MAIVDLSTKVPADWETALGFLIAFYYGLTGVACAVYYRRERRRSARNRVLLGLTPVIGGAMLLGIFVEALVYYGDPANTSSPPVLGLGVPVVVGVGSLVLGFGVMLASSPAEVAGPELVSGGETGGGAG
ncbi:MAG: hypothetical protein QOE27_889 [Solirubrobacteraceae bacterium]|nr:hypothetical protein [Solirubrobacteraceae bacterium]